MQLVIMTNQTCYSFENSSFYLRDRCGAHNPTLWIFVGQAIVAFVFAALTFIKYNSISILNLNVHIDAISNTWWILYFLVSALRSVLNSIKYTVDPNHIKALEVTDWCIVALRVLMLCFALNYQRKYRSSDLVSKEIDSVSKMGNKSSSSHFFHGVKKTLVSSGIVLCCFTIVTVASILVTCILVNKDNVARNDAQYLFWIYVGSLSWNDLVLLALTFLVMTVKSSEGPHLKSKIILFLAVILSIPSDLPFHIWRNCLFTNPCVIDNILSIYDVVILLHVLALFLFFLLMRLEYLRLKQECQWAMLREVHQFRF